MVFAKFGLASHSSSSSLASQDHSNHEDHPLELQINIESPPCVLYGSAMESSGALLNGLLTVSVKNDDFITATNSNSLTPINSHQRRQISSTLSSSLSYLSLSNMHHHGSGDELAASKSVSSLSGPQRTLKSLVLNTVELALIQRVHYERPFRLDSTPFNNCSSCKNKMKEFHRWTIIDKPTELVVGNHSFPFSHLIPGTLPVTTHMGLNSHTTVKYELMAVVTYRHPFRGKGESAKRVLRLSLPIPITRSVLRGADKTSLRVFPPTDLTANAVLPNVVYPKSTFSMELRIEGVCTKDRRWRMRKLNWRIEEKTRIRAYACEAHKSKLKHIEEKVRQDQECEERLKKGTKPMKRTYGAGPQVRMTVTPPHLPSLQQPDASNGHTAPNLNIQSSAAETESNEDEADNDLQDTSSAFVHPSDDAMREEILEHQQRLRQQQIAEELKQESLLYTEEVRIIADGEMKNGWKSDFSGNGSIGLVTDIDCMKLNSGVTNPVNHASTRHTSTKPNEENINVSCDIEDPSLGIYVSHQLYVEIIVAEEHIQNSAGTDDTRGQVTPASSTPVRQKNSADQRLAELSPIFAERENKPIPSSDHHTTNANGTRVVGVPTGAARVLRMQFRLTVTERSGLGISWDDEVPPAYHDISLLSPPGYVDTAFNTKLSDPASATNTSSDGTMMSSEKAEALSGSQLEVIRPPPALHHSSNSSSTLNSWIQFSDIDNVMSIQGAEPGFNSVLTPQNTRTMVIPNISEFLDTDRITQ